MKDLVESWISKAADGARCLGEAMDLFGPVELFFGGAARMQAPRCQVESVDFKLCGGQMHFEVLGGRHVVATQEPH